MPSALISEARALEVTRVFDSLPPAEQQGARDFLKQYERQQTYELGEPLFPSLAAQERDEVNRFRGVFEDLRKVDEVFPAVAAVAPSLEKPDEARARSANVAFLARRYGKPEDEVNQGYSLYRRDYANRTWKETGDLDEMAFYTRAAGEVSLEKAREAATNEARAAAVRAASAGLPIMSAMQQAQASNWDQDQSAAFIEAYEAANAVLTPHRPAIERFVSESAKDLGEAEADSLLETLADMTQRERRIVLAAAWEKSRSVGEEGKGRKGWFAQAASSLGRFAGADSGEYERALDVVPTTPGRVTTAVASIRTPEDARRFVTEQADIHLAKKLTAASTMSLTTGGGTVAFDARAMIPGAETRELTAEEAKLIEDAKERAVRKVGIAREVRAMSHAASPNDSVTASTVGSSMAIMGITLATRGRSAPILAQLYTSNNYDQLRLEHRDLKPADAHAIAATAGALETLPDLFGMKVMQAMPSVKALVEGGLKRELLKRAGAGIVGTMAYENVQEGVQDLTLPAVHTLFAAVQKDIPGFKWQGEGGEWERFFKGREDVAIGLLPLLLFGQGVASARDVAGARQILTDNASLGQAGYAEADRVKVITLAGEGKMEEAQAALVEAQERRSPEVAAEFQDQAAAQRVEVERAVEDAVSTGIMPRIARTGAGWTVTDNTGESVTVQSRAEAVNLAGAGLEENERTRLDSITEAFDLLSDGGDVLDLDSTRVRSLKAGEADVGGNWTAEQATRAAITQGVLEGMTEEAARDTTFAVLGFNKVERAERVRDGVAAFVNVATTELNAGATVLTAIEEGVHGNYTRGLREGKWTQQEGLQWVRLAERITGQKFLPMEDAAVLAEPESRGLSEAVAAVVLADTVGRRKDGSRMLSGAVSRGLVAEMRNAKAADKGAAGKLRQFLRAWREYFAQVFSKARVFAKARKEGKVTADFDTFLDGLLGVDANEAHAAAVAKEAKAMNQATQEESGAEDAGNLSAENAPFSLAPIKRLDFVANRLQILLGSQPEKAQRFAERATANLNALRARWASLPEPMAKPELDKRQARIVEQRRGELEEQFTAEVERDTGGIAYMPELAKLTEHPLADLLRTSDSRRKRYYAWRLESPSRWRKRQIEERGTAGGDYDGADGLPSIWFQGQGRGSAPDLIAEEAFSAGLIKEPSTDALWNGIRQMLSNVATNKARLQAAQEALKDARKRAKQEAEYEGRAWRAEQDAEQARLGTPRAAAMRDLAAIEAVTLALPAEVRAKLPTGLSGVAELSTDKAFAAEVNRRLLAVGNALNKHWKAKNRESLDELLKLGQGKREGGKKPTGTATAPVHEYFAYVAKVEGMDAAELIGERAKVDAGREAAAGTEGELQWIERGQILDAWGGFDSMHIQAQSEQLAQGWDFYRTGRREWLDKEGKRLKGQRENSAKLVEQAGQGFYEKLGKGQSVGGTLKSLEVELRDFEGVLSALLGREHELTKRWAGEVSRGYGRREDAMRALRARWQGALDAAMPGTSRRKQRQRLYEMRTKQAISVTIKEEKANPRLTAEDKKRLDSSGATPELVEGAVKLTEDQAVFLTMTARQSQYVQPLAMAGFTPPVMAEIESKLSPEAKTLREWMGREYDAGHAPLSAVLEEMNGIKLPKIPNYSPGRFYNWGNEKPLDVMGTGTVNGGFASGFLMDRKAHFSQVKLASALGVFWTHQHEAIHWSNLAPIVREMRGTLRNPDVKRSIEGAWGEVGNQLLESWMLAIEGNGLRQNAGAFERMISWATTHFAVGKLAYNAGTIVKQSLAVLNTSMDEVPFGLWLMGAGEVMKHPARFADIYRSNVIQNRLENGFSPEVRMLLDKFWTSKPGFAVSAMESGMELLGFADAFFTSVSAAVVYESNARLAERAGMTSAQAHLIGMEKMTEAVRRTSQPQTADRRSIMEHRAGALGKLGLLFMTEARQKWAIYSEALRNTVKGKPTKRDLRNLAIAHLLLSPLMAGLSAAIRDWRDGPDDGDDDPAWELSDFVIAATIGPIGQLPLIGQAVDGLKDKMAGRYRGGKGSNVLADPILAVTSGLWDLAFGENEMDAEKVLRIMSEIGGAPGVTANILRQVKDAADQAGGQQKTGSSST